MSTRAQNFFTGGLLLYLAMLVLHSRAALGAVDVSFDPGTGANNGVFSIAVQPDGKVLIGGQFTVVSGTNRNYIARLNTNGSLDASFNPGTGPSSYVNSVALQSDGKVLIGGGFTTVNGASRDFIARLNADGSLDGSFHPTAGADSTVNSVAVQLDGGVLIGGDFTTVNGVSRNRIARLDTEGNLDAGFNPVTGANNSVFSVAVQSTNKVLIGGDFTTVNGVSRKRIARLNANGSLDGGFNPGGGADNFVLSVAAQPDDKVLIGGGFTTVNGASRNRITRLNADGSLDGGFNPGTGANDHVFCVAAQPDGKVLIGGIFSAVNGTSRNCIARLNADGSLDNSFDPGTGADSYVLSIAVQSDAKVLIGGEFATVDGVSRRGIARLADLPLLTITRSGANVLLAWPTNAPGFNLQSATNLISPVTWMNSTSAPGIVVSNFVVTNSASASRQFFRLSKP